MERIMKYHSEHKRRGAIAFGAMVLTAGVILLLANFGMIDMRPYWQYWPMILIALALSKIVFPEHRKEFAEGFWLLTIGAWLQVSTLQWYGLTFANSWPMLLVGFGVHLMLKPAKSSRHCGGVEVHHVS
jgi:hypothetical protein